MKTVVVNWVIEDRVLPAGSKAPHHFHVGLGLLEVDVPLADRSASFSIDPGVYSGFVSINAEDGTELAAPLIFTDVVVPEDVMAPVPVSVTFNVQG